MQSILEQITDWLKSMIISGIMGNLSGMFDSVNQQVGQIAGDVGTTPANFSPAVFSMIRNISESVILPIAGMVLTFIACYELIQMLIEHIWYANATAQNGWSRNVLVHQIESGLYQRQVLAGKVTNFERRLPSPQSELAVQTMKDPYVFDFIPFREDMLERDIEQALVRDVTKLLLELGTGFAFLGNQYHLNVGGDDFYIDLLFYNLNLRCYVVIELKTGEFKPEYAGQLNFYLSAVDGILKKEQDNPSIGLLLCKSKNNVVAEYSLKDISKPIGVSEYKVTSSLPVDLEKQLPSVEDIQKRIK